MLLLFGEGTLVRCTVSWDIETCSLTQLKLAPKSALFESRT